MRTPKKFYRIMRKVRARNGRGPQEKYNFVTLEVGQCFGFDINHRHMQTMVCRKNKKFAPKKFRVNEDAFGNHFVYRIA